jgi:hypothetical protein
MRNTIFALVLVAVLPACYQTTVRTGRQMSGETHTQTSHIFIEGLVGGHVKPPCEPAQIVTKQTFLDIVIGTLTAGLYTPATVTTTCAIQDGPATATR